MKLEEGLDTTQTEILIKHRCQQQQHVISALIVTGHVILVAWGGSRCRHLTVDASL